VSAVRTDNGAWYVELDELTERGAEELLSRAIPYDPSLRERAHRESDGSSLAFLRKYAELHYATHGTELVIP